MEFDSYDPAQTDRLLKVAAERQSRRPTRALLTEYASGLLVLSAAVALACLGHISAVPLTPLHVVLVVGLFLACQRVEFPVASAFTLPTQLALVPMLLFLPVSWVPLVVIGCRVISLVRPGRPLVDILKEVPTWIADVGYTLGPVLVLLITDQHRFGWQHWPIYAAAMAAQIGVDLAIGATRLWFGERTPPRDWLPVVAWLHLVDVSLTCVGLFVVASAQQRPDLVVLVLPIVGLLWLFARERRQRMESSKDLSTAYRGAAALLGDVLEDDDAYTGVHSREVADLSMAVALKLELTPVQLFNVEYGALLHDVGKLRVPKSILQKPGKLSPEEWKIMREHTIAGEQMLAMVGGSLAGVGRIVRHSHERYDGTGYPDRLVAQDIPLESRIVSAADAWNAMTTSRPYRRALTIETASAEMLRCSGSHFDPVVVAALLAEVNGPFYRGGSLASAAMAADAAPR